MEPFDEMFPDGFDPETMGDGMFPGAQSSEFDDALYGVLDAAQQEDLDAALLGAEVDARDQAIASEVGDAMDRAGITLPDGLSADNYLEVDSHLLDRLASYEQPEPSVSLLTRLVGLRADLDFRVESAHEAMRNETAFKIAADFGYEAGEAPSEEVQAAFAVIAEVIPAPGLTLEAVGTPQFSSEVQQILEAEADADRVRTREGIASLLVHDAANLDIGAFGVTPETNEFLGLDKTVFWTGIAGQEIAQIPEGPERDKALDEEAAKLSEEDPRDIPVEEMRQMLERSVAIFELAADEPKE